MFVATSICDDKRFVVRKYFCRYKHTFVFVATNILTRQKLYLCQLSPVIDDEVQRQRDGTPSRLSFERELENHISEDCSLGSFRSNN